MSILEALMTVLDAEHAEAVIDHRKAKRCKLTPYAAKLLAKQFALCPDPNAAADEMILRGWTGFRADWIRERRTNMDAATRLIASLELQDEPARQDPSHQGDIGHGQFLPAPIRH